MNETIKKNGITFGLILGAFLILRTTLIYTIDINLFVNGYIGFIDIIVTIVLGVVAVAKIKKAFGGFITFKEAFSGFLLTMVIGVVLYSIFNIILFNVIDPDAKTVIREKVIEKTVAMMQGMGTPSDVLSKSVKSMRETDSFAPAQQLLGLGITIMMYAVVGLIVAAIVKKENPFGNTHKEVNNIGAQ